MNTPAKRALARQRERRRRLRLAGAILAWWEAGLGPRDDPPVSGPRCAVCGRIRPKIARAQGDPFCSTECCRVWHDPQAVRWRAWVLGRAADPRARALARLGAQVLDT